MNAKLVVFAAVASLLFGCALASYSSNWQAQGAVVPNKIVYSTRTVTTTVYSTVYTTVTQTAPTQTYSTTATATETETLIINTTTATQTNLTTSTITVTTTPSTTQTSTATVTVTITLEQRLVTMGQTVEMKGAEWYAFGNYSDCKLLIGGQYREVNVSQLVGAVRVLAVVDNQAGIPDRCVLAINQLVS